MAVRAFRAFGFMTCLLLAACAEGPQRIDVPPASRAGEFEVEVSTDGQPALLTPAGPIAGLLGGALVGGQVGCNVSLACYAAPVTLPLGAVIGLGASETPGRIADTGRMLRSNGIVERIGPLLVETVVATGNQRSAMSFVANESEHAAGSPPKTRMKLVMEPKAIGIRQGKGGMVFTLQVAVRLGQQALHPFSYQSTPRRTQTWLVSTHDEMDRVMADAATGIAQDIVTTLFPLRDLR